MLYYIQADLFTLVGSIAVIGTLATRAVDHSTNRKDTESQPMGSRLKSILLRMVVLAFVVGGCCVFFASKKGSWANAELQTAAGLNDLAGYRVISGPAPF